jgi:hypothetical protein
LSTPQDHDDDESDGDGCSRKLEKYRLLKLKCPGAAAGVLDSSAAVAAAVTDVVAGSLTFSIVIN